MNQNGNDLHNDILMFGNLTDCIGSTEGKQQKMLS
jgi:hypothetical protein